MKSMILILVVRKASRIRYMVRLEFRLDFRK
jgi:hypothetical protein